MHQISHFVGNIAMHSRLQNKWKSHKILQQGNVNVFVVSQRRLFAGHFSPTWHKYFSKAASREIPSKNINEILWSTLTTLTFFFRIIFPFSLKVIQKIFFLRWWFNMCCEKLHGVVIKREEKQEKPDFSHVKNTLPYGTQMVTTQAASFP